jgi:hypothetical protein
MYVTKGIYNAQVAITDIKVEDSLGFLESQFGAMVTATFI